MMVICLRHSICASCFISQIHTLFAVRFGTKRGSLSNNNELAVHPQTVVLWPHQETIEISPRKYKYAFASLCCPICRSIWLDGPALFGDATEPGDPATDKKFNQIMDKMLIGEAPSIQFRFRTDPDYDQSYRQLQIAKVVDTSIENGCDCGAKMKTGCYSEWIRHWFVCPMVKHPCPVGRNFRVKAFNAVTQMESSESGTECGYVQWPKNYLDKWAAIIYNVHLEVWTGVLRHHVMSSCRQRFGECPSCRCANPAIGVPVSELEDDHKKSHLEVTDLLYQFSDVADFCDLFKAFNQPRTKESLNLIRDRLSLVIPAFSTHCLKF